MNCNCNCNVLIVICVTTSAGVELDGDGARWEVQVLENVVTLSGLATGLSLVATFGLYYFDVVTDFLFIAELINVADATAVLVASLMLGTLVSTLLVAHAWHTHARVRALYTARCVCAAVIASYSGTDTPIVLRCR